MMSARWARASVLMVATSHWEALAHRLQALSWCRVGLDDLERVAPTGGRASGRAYMTAFENLT